MAKPIRQTIGAVFRTALTESEKETLRSGKYCRDLEIVDMEKGGTRVKFTGAIKWSDSWYDGLFLKAFDRKPDVVLRDAVVHGAALQARRAELIAS